MGCSHRQPDVRVVGDEHVPASLSGSNRRRRPTRGRGRAARPPCAVRTGRATSPSSQQQLAGARRARRRRPSRRAAPAGPARAPGGGRGRATVAERAAALALAHHRRGALLAEPRDRRRGRPAPRRPRAAARRASVAGRMPRTSTPRRSRVAHQRRRRVEAHRLRVEQRAQERRGVVPPQPGALVGEQRERRGVRLGEAERREGEDLVEHRAGRVLRARRGRRAPSRNACHCASIAARERRRLMARRRVSAWPGVKPASAYGHVEHLVLEDDHAERLARARSSSSGWS